MPKFLSKFFRKKAVVQPNPVFSRVQQVEVKSGRKLQPRHEKLFREINPIFFETQKIEVKGKIEQNDPKLVHENKVKDLLQKYKRPARVMYFAIERKKKLNSSQQRFLSKRIKRLESMLDEASRKEMELDPNTRVYSQEQRARLNKMFDYSEALVKLSLELENSKLVDKGFTHKTFRKTNTVVSNQKQ